MIKMVGENLTLISFCLFIALITGMVNAKDYPWWVNYGMAFIAGLVSFVTFNYLPFLF